MGDQWCWTYAGRDGAPFTGAPATTTTFPTQADAEAWFAETWEELARAGVAAVSLHREGELVYGPMSLDPPS